LEQAVAVNPMTNCLAQLRKLEYVYDNVVSHGESKLQVSTRKVFKDTRVWLSVEDDEETAIWKRDKQDGPKWLKNIIFELNIVIMNGKGNTRRVLMVGAELKESEKLYSSTSVLAYFTKVKDMAHKHRMEEKKFIDGNDRFKNLTRDKSDSLMVKRAKRCVETKRS